MMKTLTRKKGTQRSQAEGFTMVEVLVVFAVLGILIALLIPAVQAAREAARRSYCIGNLKQMGIAINVYVNTNTLFPRGANGNGYSLHTMILPGLEQGNLYNAVNFDIDSSQSKSWVIGPNQTVVHSSLSVFLCPSNSQSSWSDQYAQTNYMGNGGFGLAKYGHIGLFTDSAVIDFNKPISMASVSDGSSNTVAASETVVVPGGSISTHDTNIITFAVPGLTAPSQFDELVTLCESRDPNKDAFGFNKFAEWMVGDYAYTLFDFASTPNSHSCNPGGQITYGIFPASSNHPAGVNVVFIDGHVKFVLNTVERGHWRSLSTIAGNEAMAQY